MNQILITEKLYVTPELKRKKKIYKFDFVIILYGSSSFEKRLEFLISIPSNSSYKESQNIFESSIK